MKITLYGRIPSKKNSTWNKTVIGKGGKLRQVKLPSRKFADWHKRQEQYLFGLGELWEKTDVENPKDIWQVALNFFMPCNRRTDLTNKAESVMDLLVDCGIIKDDSWQHIPQVLLNCEGVDKENPRVEIEIKCR